MALLLKRWVAFWKGKGLPVTMQFTIFVMTNIKRTMYNRSSWPPGRTLGVFAPKDCCHIWRGHSQWHLCQHYVIWWGHHVPTHCLQDAEGGHHLGSQRDDQDYWAQVTCLILISKYLAVDLAADVDQQAGHEEPVPSNIHVHHKCF